MASPRCSPCAAQSALYDLRARLPELEHLNEVATSADLAALDAHLDALALWLEEDPGQPSVRPPLHFPAPH